MIWGGFTGSFLSWREREDGGRSLLSVLPHNLQREKLALLLICLFGKKKNKSIVFYCIISATELDCPPSLSTNFYPFIFSQYLQTVCAAENKFSALRKQKKDKGE